MATTSKSSSKKTPNPVSDFGRNVEKSKFSTEPREKKTGQGLDKMFQILSQRSFRVKR